MTLFIREYIFSDDLFKYFLSSRPSSTAIFSLTLTHTIQAWPTLLSAWATNLGPQMGYELRSQLLDEEGLLYSILK